MTPPEVQEIVIMAHRTEGKICHHWFIIKDVNEQLDRFSSGPKKLRMCHSGSVPTQKLPKPKSLIRGLNYRRR